MPSEDVVHHVYILDIDGTMMPSKLIDNECFWQAVDEVIGGASDPADLHGFEHVTDSGILLEWMDQQHGRPAGKDEEQAIRTRFLELRMAAEKRQPGLFRPLPGLIDWLRFRRTQPGISLAIATGGWAQSARFKLSVAGLDQFQLPMASSDEAISRTDIMEIALRRAIDRKGAENSGKVTYIGDGAWDFAASRALGWSFIGIAEGEQAARLRAAGAMRIVQDFNSLIE